jgi:hypothetical protein
MIFAERLDYGRQLLFLKICPGFLMRPCTPPLGFREPLCAVGTFQHRALPIVAGQSVGHRQFRIWQ